MKVINTPCKAGTFSSETMKSNSILRLAIHENTWFASEYGKICLERKRETTLVAFTPRGHWLFCSFDKLYTVIKQCIYQWRPQSKLGPPSERKEGCQVLVIYSVSLAFSLMASTVSTVLASSSEISPAASLASSCSTISACIFSLIFTLNMNTSRLSTIRTSGT